MKLHHIIDSNIFLKKMLPLAMFIKIILFIVFFYHFYVQIYQNNNTMVEKFTLSEEILHIIYNIMMGIILVYIFNHTGKICISGKVKEYLFLFGFLMILINIKNIMRKLYLLSDLI